MPLWRRLVRVILPLMLSARGFRGRQRQAQTPESKGLERSEPCPAGNGRSTWQERPLVDRAADVGERCAEGAGGFSPAVFGGAARVNSRAVPPGPAKNLREPRAERQSNSSRQIDNLPPVERA